MRLRGIIGAGLVLVSAFTTVDGQSTTPTRRFSITAGVNAAKVSNDLETSISRKIGLIAGVSAVFPVGPSFSIQPEVLYTMKGGKFDGEGEDATLKMDYLQIPLLGRFDVATTGKAKPFLYGGPAVGFRAKCEIQVSAAASPGEATVDCDQFEDDAKIKSVDYGMVIGGGIGFDLSSYVLGIAARYDHSFSAFSADGDPKHRVISVVMSLEFPWRQ